MPKLKTKKAAAKRFRVKPSGNIKRDCQNHEHLATKKSRSHKNKLKKARYVEVSDKNRVISCLPYK